MLIRVAFPGTVPLPAAVGEAGGSLCGFLLWGISFSKELQVAW